MEPRHPQDGQPQPPGSPWAPYTPEPPQRFRHSGFGIASFVISIVASLVIFGGMIIGTAVEVASRRAPTRSAGAVSVGGAVFALTILFFEFAALVGVALAIAGLVDRRAKRVFPILGLIFNGLLLVTSVLVAVLINTGG